MPKEEHPGRLGGATGLPPGRTRKVFVGGLAPSVDEAALRQYFEQVLHDTMLWRCMKGSLHFKNSPLHAIICTAHPLLHLSLAHAAHHDTSASCIVVSAVQFGPVDDAVVMLDHENRRPRGFGFVTFANEDTVDDVLNAGPLQVGSTYCRGAPHLACKE